MAHTPQNTIHTPAPWKLDELPISDGKHWYLCAFYSRDIGEIVCEVPLGDKVATPEEIANARLITAAPELLEALIVAESHLGWKGKGPNDHSHYYCEFCGKGDAPDSKDVVHAAFCKMNLIRRAIVKATGAA